MIEDEHQPYLDEIVMEKSRDPREPSGLRSLC